MGAKASTGKGLDGCVSRAESRVGKIAVSGRYHTLPKKLEDDYEMASEVLGSGYNGQVFVATSKATKAKFAVKGFKLHGVPKDKREELEAEAEIFLGMDHPHVCRLVDAFEGPDHLHLVMECMTGGELFQRVSAKKRFDEKDAADASWQMLLAVNYLHSQQVVHRDIKLENWLYDTPESDHLKLIDFGFSKIWKPNTKMALSCGTLAYVAPEVLAQSYTSQCDLWSLGVTVFILLMGYMPFFGSLTEQTTAIKQGAYLKRQKAWDRVSGDAQDFLTKLLVVKPDVRLTAEQALKHKWIQQRDAMETGVMDKSMVDALMDFHKATAFRRAAMNMMAWSLTNEERTMVRQAFVELDKDRQGTVSLKEFKSLLEDKFHVTDAEATEAFKALDSQSTEEIHYSDFLAAMVQSRVGMHEELLQAAFKRFDLENEGVITVKDLKKVLGETFEGEKVEDMLKEADLSHDGKISYQEWIQYLRDGHEQEDHGWHQGVAAAIIDSKVKNDDERPKKIKAKDEALKAAEAAPQLEGEPQGCGCTAQ